jgi:nitrogen regulatory protein PII
MTAASAPCNLIVTIVNKGRADEVIQAAKAAGAQGGTILPGRSSGDHRNQRLFGIVIEPEKDIVLTLIEASTTTAVLRAITEALGLEKPGAGIAFVLPVTQAVGIALGGA